MRRIVITEAALRKRDEIAAQRQRFYDAKAAGMSHDEANDIANGTVELPEVKSDQREIPADWASLSYLPRVKGGPSLRGIASKLGQPVNSMADAVAVIEAELARRG